VLSFQDYYSKELIIIDNGSTDQTPEINPTLGKLNDPEIMSVQTFLWKGMALIVGFSINL